MATVGVSSVFSSLSKQGSEILRLQSIEQNLWTYISPIILFFGTIGNVLCCITLVRLVRQGKTFALYFSVLAVSDIIYLNTGLLRQWVKVLIDIDIRDLGIAVCKVHSFVVNWSSHLSSWLLVAATMQRLFSVILPLKARDIFTPANIWISILAISVCLAGVDAVLFWTEGEAFEAETNTTYKCSYVDEHKFFASSVWPWIDLMLLVVIPFIIMFISNIVIIRTVCKTVQLRRTMSQNHGRGGVHTNSNITAMMLTTSFTFLLLMSPMAISLTFINNYVPDFADDLLKEAQTDLAWAIVSLLAYTNNAINFLLYCISGALFRRALLSFCCYKYREPLQRRSTVYTVDTTRCGTLDGDLETNNGTAAQQLTDTDLFVDSATHSTQL